MCATAGNTCSTQLACLLLLLLRIVVIAQCQGSSVSPQEMANVYGSFQVAIIKCLRTKPLQLCIASFAIEIRKRVVAGVRDFTPVRGISILGKRVRELLFAQSSVLTMAKMLQWRCMSRH